MPTGTTETTTVGTPAAMPAALCDVDGCNEPAVAGYSWDWGESGYCCARHQVILGQRAKSLRRHVAFAGLRPGTPTEITRSERTQLHAARLAAEDETRETKQRNLELYNSNQLLSRELTSARTDCEELRSQIADLRTEVDALVGDKAELRSELADKTSELVRLQGMLNATNTSP